MKIRSTLTNAFLASVLLAISQNLFFLSGSNQAKAQEGLRPFQTCNYFAGTAVTGQSVNVDLCSISPASPRSVDFVYYLGNEKVASQANCAQGTWISFPERQVNRPQSQATQRMLEVVCSYRVYSPRRTSRVGAAIVFDPPSNVRASPNGDILCSVRERSTINIYGSVGSWNYTNVCGTMGVIHSSQIRF